MLAAVRRFLPALFAALAAGSLLGCLLSAPASAKPKRTCYPKRSRTVDVNAVARVFRRRETIPGTGGLVGTVVYGCDLKTKRRIRVAEADYYAPDAWVAVLRGRYVAANYTETDPAGVAGGYLRVWDLRAHRRVHAVEDVRAFDLEIGPRGSLAWIGAPVVDEGGSEPPTQVHTLDGRGDRTVATGNVARRSLALSGSTLYWTQDGAPRSATLEP